MEENKPKYEILRKYIKEKIMSGEISYGEKILSENELAAKFSLSRFTVRRSIELLTNEGLLEKRHGSGTYVKAANLEKTRSGIVGIITTYLDDYIFPSIIKGIEDVMTEHSFAINLGITGNKVEKEAACLRTMLDNNVDGLIIEGTKSALPNPNVDILNEFKAKHIPIVFINGNYAEYDSAYVMMDDNYSGKIATEYLIKNGHKVIGGIFKSDDIQGHRRYGGYAAALREKGLHVPEESILWYTTEDLAEIFSDSYAPIFKKRFKKCSAILCYNDQIAVKAIEALEKNGRHVPKDISVVGFDNSDLCEVNSVRLTSVSHSRSLMGRQAAEILISLMADFSQELSKCKVNLKSELIIRDSVEKII